MLLRSGRREEREMGISYKGRMMSRLVGGTGRGYDWFDNVYNGLVISGGMRISYMMAKNVDKG